MTEYKQFLEEAAKRDHRRIGKDQELFFFHDLSPGSCFWLPHGTRIYNTLMDFIREEYRKRGYSEVISPNMYNSELWKTSGHWQNYADNMFKLDVEKEVFALKVGLHNRSLRFVNANGASIQPMNCPGHCLIFGSRERSYRELPIRMADFGVLHRNEASGALTGLTRVRRFQQDDAHVFCTVDQVRRATDQPIKSANTPSIRSKMRYQSFSTSCNMSMGCLASLSSSNCPHGRIISSETMPLGTKRSPCWQTL
jgi:threonyl-tRNA synthetase